MDASGPLEPFERVINKAAHASGDVRPADEHCMNLLAVAWIERFQ
jgi:hypothetical protein